MSEESDQQEQRSHEEFISPPQKQEVEADAPAPEASKLPPGAVRHGNAVSFFVPGDEEIITVPIHGKYNPATNKKLGDFLK